MTRITYAFTVMTYDTPRGRFAGVFVSLAPLVSVNRTMKRAGLETLRPVALPAEYRKSEP